MPQPRSTSMRSGIAHPYAATHAPSPARQHRNQPSRGARRGPSRAQILCDIMAEEVGISPEEFTELRTVSDMGVDSVLMFTIAHRYKAVTGEDLGVRFLYSDPTITDIFEHLDGTAAPSPSSSDNDDTSSNASSKCSTSSVAPARRH